MLTRAKRRRSRRRSAAFGPGTTLLVDTYDVAQGIRNAVEVAGPDLGAVRIDSGDLAGKRPVPGPCSTSSGPPRTRLVVTGDLDAHTIAALGAAPVDVYGVGANVVTGMGVPTAGFVYKLVAIGEPGTRRRTSRITPGGETVAREGVLRRA